MTTEAQVEGTEVYREAFNKGFEAAVRLFWGTGPVDGVEDVKKLPAGSCVRDGRGKVWFRTTSNGWVSVASTHCASMYLALPVEVLYHGG